MFKGWFLKNNFGQQCFQRIFLFITECGDISWIFCIWNANDSHSYTEMT